MKTYKKFLALLSMTFLLTSCDVSVFGRNHNSETKESTSETDKNTSSDVNHDSASGSDDATSGGDTTSSGGTTSGGDSSSDTTSGGGQGGGSGGQEDDGYYASIGSNLTGDALLSALRTLNKNKRTSTVGYSAMGTSPSGQFKYTDYDPSTVQYDSNGQPYGTKIISFYSGNSTTSFNREHVWPDSHGGNLVEKDIHMPRPTIASENGSRGNSFYVEGMCDQSNGWDPAEEDFGDATYRGDSARIIFYCVVASSDLSLIEATYHATSKKNRDNLMGKLSDMLSWNERYPVMDREQRRNDGAEYLQGNRNPFIDHPEYACKIWGNTNDATRQACGL